MLVVAGMTLFYCLVHLAGAGCAFYSGGNKSTGLGLAIAGKIVENHGGTLAVESPVPGKRGGCRFTISLPITTEEERFS